MPIDPTRRATTLDPASFPRGAPRDLAAALTSGDRAAVRRAVNKIAGDLDADPGSVGDAATREIVRALPVLVGLGEATSDRELLRAAADLMTRIESKKFDALSADGRAKLRDLLQRARVGAAAGPPPSDASDAIVRAGPKAPTLQPKTSSPTLPTIGRTERVTAGDAAKGTRPRSATAHSLSIGDPFTDSSVHASHYKALPAAMGYAFEAFARKYPDVDRNLAYRFLELAVVIGAEVPWMVYSHEAGHYRAAKHAGWDAEIEMTGWMSGLTRYRFPPGAAPTDAEHIAASAAGVNQEMLNSVHMFRNWATSGGAYYQEALGYLLAQTNLALYAARSFSKGGETSSWDDMAAYVRRLETSGHDVELVEIMGLAIAADLLSAPFWAALIGTGKFIATGERRVEIPTFHLGSTEMTFPNFHVFLDTTGPIVGMTLFVDPKGVTPLELRADVRTDGTGAAIAARLHGISLTERLRLTPLLGASFSDDRGFGYTAGADLELDLSRHVGVTFGATYSHDYLLSGVEGRSDGVTVRGGLTLHF